MRRRLATSLLLVFCAITVAVALLVGTEAGSRWLLARAAAVMPGELSWTTLRGTLVRGIAVDNLEWRGAAGRLTAAELSLRIDGLALLGGRIVLREPDLRDVEWREGAGSTNDTAINLPPIVLDHARIANLRLSLAAGDFTIDALDFDARLDVQTLALTRVTAVAGNRRLQGTGSITLAAPYALQTTFDWEAPLPPVPGIEATDAKGSTTLTGDLGRLHVDHVLERPFDVRSLGTVDLADGLRLDLDHRWRNVETAFLESAEGRLTTRGPLDDLALELDGQAVIAGWSPFVASGRATHRDGTLSIDELRLTSDAGEAIVDGRIGPTLDVRARIRLDRPKALLDEDRGDALPLGGRLTADLALTGSIEAARLSGRARGDGLAWDGGQIGRIEIEAAAGLAHDERMDVRLAAASLSLGNESVEEVRLTAGGTTSRHTIDIDIDDARGSLAVRFDGGLDAGRWLGRITALEVDEPNHAGTWQLAEATRLEVDRQGFTLHETCLRQGDAQLCGSAEGQNTLHGQVRLTGLPLGGHIPPTSPVRIEARLDAEGEFACARGMGCTASMTTRLPPGALLLLLPDGPEEIAWREAVAKARLDQGVWHTEAAVTLGDGTLTAAIDIGPTATDGARPLDGHIDVEMADLRLLEALVPHLRESAGRIAANLRLGGDTQHPGLSGNLRLTQGQASLSDLGIRLREIDIELSGDGDDGLVITGSAVSGEGELRAGGRLILADGKPVVTMTLTGDRFTTADLPGLHIIASPRLQLVVEDRAVTVTGSVTIPEADIVARDLSVQGVAVSRDEIVEDRETAEARWSLDTRIDVVLGRRVSFRGHGVDTRLSGEVHIEERPGRDIRAQGEVRLDGGRYRAFGQTLEIDRGRLAFVGPIDDPALDIRAVRRVDDITAGIEIVGSLRAPQSRVFSVPPLPESDALGILLTGRPLGAASPADLGLLLNAIGTFGIDRSSSAAQDVRQASGLDEFGLVSESSEFDQTALMLGKHLSPRLYVRYTFGLFEPTAELLLRYRLSRTLTLETRSGEQQSVDLIYRKER